MTKPAAAKLIDVARLAGVCNATVSRALAREPTVSATTLKRVEDAARQLGYVPHGAASALRAQCTRTIGAVLPTLDNLIYAKATHALQKALDERGYLLLLACHEFDLKNEVKVARSLIERGVDGVVLIGAEHAEELFVLLADMEMPYVLTWALDASGRHSCVGFDNRTAAMRVANYLVDIGHRDFAMIPGVIAGNDRARERLAGVQEALALRGIALLPQHVIESPYTLAAARAAMHALMASAHPPTAVICGNDVLAMGAVLEELAALARGNAGDNLGAVINRELCVPGAKAAGDALDKDLGIGCDENGHVIFDCGFSIYDLFRLWMQIVLRSGSEMKAMWQTGVGNGSILNFTPFARKWAIAASKFSTSRPTEQPSGRGFQSGAPQPRDSVPPAMSYSVHCIPPGSPMVMVGFRPSTPS